MDCLPNPTTVSQFAYELGVISDLQVGEVLVKHSNVTLAWDATSLDAQLVNEVHVTVPTVPSTGYVLQVSVLPGRTTDDYISHLQQAINDVCQTYSLYHHLPEAAVVSQVVNHLTCTMSDRVAVNHCVVEKLQSDLDIQLLELKCNVHPLEGIAKKCRDVLKQCSRTYSTKSGIFDNDRCAANILKGMSKMRYKQGQGDPSGFKQFMRLENIKPGMIVCWQ